MGTSPCPALKATRLSEQQILIIGAGGHAQVVADILLCRWRAGELIRPMGFLDDDERLLGNTYVDLPVLGSTQQLDSISHDGVVIAIGNNRVRARLYNTLTARGTQVISAIHPATTIASDVVIETGCMICAGVIINTGSHIGPNTILNTGATVDHHNRIGAHCHIAPGVHLGGDVAIGDGTLIGIGSTIMPQRTIGQWTTVGAGALVNQDTPDKATVIGVPARPITKSEPQ